MNTVQREILRRGQQLDREYAGVRGTVPLKRFVWIVACLGTIVLVNGFSGNHSPELLVSSTQPARRSASLPTPENIAPGQVSAVAPTAESISPKGSLSAMQASAPQEASGPATLAEAVQMLKTQPAPDMKKLTSDPKMNEFARQHSWLARLTGLFSSKATESFGVQSIFGWADATKAMSLLKQYQVAQMIYLQQEGGMAGLKEFRGNNQGLLDNNILQAWDRQNSPQPMQDYLFSEMEENESGQPLDRRERAGLCAYPVKPSSSRPVLLMLIDLRTPLPASTNEGTIVTHGEEWTFYRVDSTDRAGPLHRWPNSAELGTTFVKLKKRTPTEALAEAKQLAAQAGEPQYPTPEMAERVKAVQASAQAELKTTDIKGKLAKLRPLLYLYFEQNNRVPSQAEGLEALVALSGGVLKPGDLIDPWGSPFLYRTEEETIRNEKMIKVFAYSAGPDRQDGTRDDVFPW